ncbi:hypothetical protein TA3x_004903 [Tundrisphaera sp. TA3]|uniref:hypothetical protein n=1 Tax=Tundrisphaera sp. TA3 TaxID=3435775 RepID=UPI003EBD7C94
MPTMAPPAEPDACELCDRDKPLTFHHLIPKSVHKKNRFKDQYTKAEMRHSGLYLCSPCHSGIHDLIPDEKELAARYATKEALLSHEAIARHVAWVAKQK